MAPGRLDRPVHPTLGSKKPDLGLPDPVGRAGQGGQVRLAEFAQAGRVEPGGADARGPAGKDNGPGRLSRRLR